jgi:putative peptidoglycan lipid II flippase
VAAVGGSLRGFLAVAAGEGLVALQIVVDKAFASALGVGAVSILEYADRVRLVPQTLMEASLVVVAYNEWARLSAAGDVAGRERATARALVWAGLLAAPVLAAMGVGRLAIVHLLFERGAWDPRWSTPTAEALGGFLPGVWFSLLGALLVKAQILAGRQRLVLLLGVGSFVANAGLDALLGPWLGVLGLTLATTLVTAGVSVVSVLVLRPAVTGRQLLQVAVVAGVSVALVALLGGDPPRSMAGLDFWLAMAPFGLLLGAGLALARRA